ncbi:MAG: hypothetical protein JHC87_01035, partial [Thermoleophilaceae bacterium]|nr:hypothetical protein [Thermoleophilaceae bacterium]
MASQLIAESPASSLIGAPPASLAGPIDTNVDALPVPPTVPLHRYRQMLQINQRQIEYMFRWRRQLGEVFRFQGLVDDHVVVTSHPDHVRSLFTASPDLVPSLTAESPLKPIVGP